MKIDTLHYFFFSAFKDLRRNSRLTISYLFAIAATIFLSGLFAMFIMVVAKTFIAIIRTDTEFFNFVYIIKFFTRLRFIVLIIIPPVSLILISSVIKTTIFCKRHDVSIMKYLGATNAFIKGPFIIEGIVLGLVGSIIGSMLLFIPYVFMYTKITPLELDYISLVEPKLLLSSMVIPCIITGPFIAVIGDLMALRKLAKNS